MSDELDRLAAGCLLPGFAGLTPPDWLRRRLEAGLGGVVLFARNVRDREQVAALTAAMRAERPEVVVAIDEEGGDVTRLEAERGSSYPGNHALGVVDDVALTERVAAAIAHDLAGVGINVDLAPVADVNVNEANAIVGVRAFGSDPELVARQTAAFVHGLQTGGVTACAKHFPGHGNTREDSHHEVATAVGGAQALTQALLPFRAAIEAGTRSVMVGHIRVPELDDSPAVISSILLQQVLRTELGFDGMVMTDALEMRAVSATVGVEEGAVRALDAGADALCLGHDLGEDAVDRLVDVIVAAVRSNRLAEGRLHEAAERVRRVGGRAAPDGGGDSRAGEEAARRALRAEGAVGLARAPLVVELWPAPTIAAGEARHGLGDALRERLPASEVVRLHRGSSIPPSTSGRQLVIVLRDAHRHEWERAMAGELAAHDADAVVVETGLPVWRPDGVAGYVATQGAGRVNLEAAADLLVGSYGA